MAWKLNPFSLSSFPPSSSLFFNSIAIGASRHFVFLSSSSRAPPPFPSSTCSLHNGGGGDNPHDFFDEEIPFSHRPPPPPTSSPPPTYSSKCNTWQKKTTPPRQSNSSNQNTSASPPPHYYSKAPYAYNNNNWNNNWQNAKRSNGGVALNIKSVTPMSLTIFGHSGMLRLKPYPALFDRNSGHYRHALEGNLTFIFYPRIEASSSPDSSNSQHPRKYDRDRRVKFYLRPSNLGSFLISANTKFDYQITNLDKMTLKVQWDGKRSSKVVMMLSYPSDESEISAETLHEMGGGGGAFPNSSRAKESKLFGRNNKNGEGNGGVSSSSVMEKPPQQEAKEKGEGDWQEKKTVEHLSVNCTIGEYLTLRSLIKYILPTLYGWQTLVAPSSVSHFINLENRAKPSFYYSGGAGEEEYKKYNDAYNDSRYSELHRKDNYY